MLLAPDGVDKNGLAVLRWASVKRREVVLEDGTRLLERVPLDQGPGRLRLPERRRDDQRARSARLVPHVQVRPGFDVPADRLEIPRERRFVQADARRRWGGR